MPTETQAMILSTQLASEKSASAQKDAVIQSQAAQIANLKLTLVSQAKASKQALDNQAQQLTQDKTNLQAQFDAYKKTAEDTIAKHLARIDEVNTFASVEHETTAARTTELQALQADHATLQEQLKNVQTEAAKANVLPS